MVSKFKGFLFKQKNDYEVAACFFEKHVLILNVARKPHENVCHGFSSLPFGRFSLNFSAIGRFFQCT
jgi:hypothetical protein